MIRAQFGLGAVVSTPGAIEAMKDGGNLPSDFLRRHVAGDWGDVPPEDAAENERSLANGWRILSSYKTSLGVVVWVLTEADRSSTCLLLPSEY